jgi:hypothetical protein
VGLKRALIVSLLVLGLGAPVRADVIDLIADFNSLADGANNAAVQAYFNNLLLGSGASVVVSGAKAEADYDGDGHVVGPCTLTGNYTSCNGSSLSLSKPFVTPLTLGTSDGASMGDTPRPFTPGNYNEAEFLDTFLVHDGSYKKKVDGVWKQAIKLDFTNIPFLVTTVEFDFQIFPSTACQSFPCSNLPDFRFYVDDIPVLYQLAITPPTDNRESRCTDRNSYNAPFSPGASSCSGDYERVPQWIGTVSIDLTQVPGFNVNSQNHKFEFVDWPEMIGIDNFNMPREVPEPGTLLLLGTGLVGMVLSKKRRA